MLKKYCHVRLLAKNLRLFGYTFFLPTIMMDWQYNTCAAIKTLVTSGAFSTDYKKPTL